MKGNLYQSRLFHTLTVFTRNSFGEWFGSWANNMFFHASSGAVMKFLLSQMSKCSKDFCHKCLLIWIFLHFKRFFQKIFRLSDHFSSINCNLKVVVGHFYTLFFFCISSFFSFSSFEEMEFFLRDSPLQNDDNLSYSGEKTATSSSSYRKKSFLRQCLTDSCNEPITKKYTWSIVNLITCENSTGNNLF